MEGCIFCGIASGAIPAKVLFQDDHVVAFHDIHPVAPVHVLVIPKRHVASLAETAPGDEDTLGRLLAAARRAAVETGVAESGFRTVVNTGEGAGQSVFHLHVHVLGGRTFPWPP
jgi:histidine triad (HIT) family protein